MTQGERIINYLECFGSISPMEAFIDLGITKLATRISELKKEGYEFNQVYEGAKNRFGEPVHYMRYSLLENVSNRKDGSCEKLWGVSKNVWPV